MSTLHIGDRFGKYRILDVLGQGGMGDVYLAEDEMLGRDIALKVLDRALTASGHFEERFRQEAHLIACLDHPHIVRINSLEKVQDYLAIDMTYVEGGSLADARADGPLLLTEALDYIRDVLLALACCHDAGIIHRDVKASNILLTGEDKALLTDFGLAKSLVSHAPLFVPSITTSSCLFVGTPKYAPPEAWDAAEPTPAWDVYSVGMVLYEAVAERYPYDAVAPLSLMKQILERPVPPLIESIDSVSSELNDLVGRMLSHIPGERPPDAAVALELLHQTPEMANRPGPDAITVVARRRRRRVWRQNRRRELSAAWRRSRRLVLAASLIALALAFGYAVNRIGIAPGNGMSTAVNVSEPVALDASNYWVFDTLDPARELRWPNHAMLERVAGSDDWTLLAAGGTHLWYLTARSDGSDRLLIDGNWAEYADESARIFRHGAVSGTGLWDDARPGLTLSLDFFCVQDGMRWSRVFIMAPRIGGETPRQFAESAAVREFFQPLVYRELIPRNLDWARALDNWMVEAGPPPIVARIEGTGQKNGFAEPDWGSGRLLLTRDDDAVRFALQLPEGLTNPILRVAVQTAVSVPLSQSPAWFFEADLTGPLAHVHRHHGYRDRVDSPWAVEWTPEEAPREVAVEVPFDMMEASERPDRANRWRMNVQVVDADGDEERMVASWGAADYAVVDRGRIVSFTERQ